ncbi:MAG: cohesin domain-containing protein [Candidatus Nealsonbacteria bacterium]|nr:cohesin domain-containing protein [Candidatus Nealsonbacteria bacterium]
MNKRFRKFDKKIICLILGLAFLFNFYLPAPVKAAGASLNLSPSTGTYVVGSNFSVKAKVDSGGNVINAAEAVLNFNTSELEVVSVSKTGSIFTLWTTEPAFSNSTGIISFGGGTPQNFSGTAGTIITITFKAKVVGTAKVNFSSGSVLAADFKGTNVLTSLISGSYTITPTIITPPAEEYIPPANAPAAPIVTSPTHPDSEKWYSNNDPKFTWQITEEITGVRLLVNDKPISIPTTFYSEPISEKQLEDLADGIWYFHAQLRNQFGWGWISHFKFRTDTQPPDPFEVLVKEGQETTSPQPTLIFEATDVISGIDYYELKIDQTPSIKTSETEYKLPTQELGKHTIIVKAIDRAGNYILAMTEINILSIEAPVITDYPRTLTPGSILSIKGTAIPEVMIKIYLQKDKKEIKMGETKSDKDGKWLYIEVEPLEKGVYEVWAEAIDSLGGKSKASNRVTILVTPPIFIRIGKLAIDYLTTFVTLLVLILIIVFMIFLGWQKLKKKKRKMEKEITEAEKALYRAFKALKEETEEQIAKLDGKPGLSENEKKICDDLKKSLRISEKFIGKEIKDIEKELE